MFNAVRLIKDPITGIKSLHLKGVNNKSTIDKIIPAYGVKLSPIERGAKSYESRVAYIHIGALNFKFDLIHRGGDPKDNQGLQHWQEINDYIGANRKEESMTFNKNLWIALMMQHKMLAGQRNQPMANGDYEGYIQALVASGEALNDERDRMIGSGLFTREELAEFFEQPAKASQ